MKIPTILGLALLIIAISLGVFLYTYKQKKDNQKKEQLTPINIQIVNTSDTQVSIVWQTKSPAIGIILSGEDNKLESKQPDDRDIEGQSPYVVHFVTIKNLKPDTNYFFQIQNDNFKFPNQAIQFKTEKVNSSKIPPNNPILGTVLDSNLQPIDEALVFLKLDKTISQATFVTAQGNYLLPLTQLKDSISGKQLDLVNPTMATLLITKGDSKSNVKITLPPTKQPLPPVILGQDLDLSAINTTSNINYDLNGDGLINTVDLSMVFEAMNQKTANSIADLNQDGVVNQEDVELIKQALGQNPQNQ